MDIGAEEDQKNMHCLKDDMSERGVSVDMTVDGREWKKKHVSIPHNVGQQQQQGQQDDLNKYSYVILMWYVIK